jgi:hypothetical protein
MKHGIGGLVRQVCGAAILGLVFLVIGCTQPPPSVAAVATKPLPPGTARIWIYRLNEPYQSLDRPYVRFNGKVVATSEPGGAFYRDVPPGQYHITVDSQGRDIYQFVTVAVAAGQQVYVQVQVSRDWDSGGGARGYWFRPTFYTRLQLPQVARAQIARSPLYGGS